MFVDCCFEHICSDCQEETNRLIERAWLLEKAIKKRKAEYQKALEHRAPTKPGYERLDIYPAYDMDLWRLV